MKKELSGLEWKMKGLAIYNETTNKINQVPSWNFGSLNNFVIRNKNELWISTRNQGAVKLDFKNTESYSYKRYTSANGLIHNQTISVF
jgi:ligand-binding sensor domain-containing protein